MQMSGLWTRNNVVKLTIYMITITVCNMIVSSSSIIVLIIIMMKPMVVARVGRMHGKIFIF